MRKKFSKPINLKKQNEELFSTIENVISEYRSGNIEPENLHQKLASLMRSTRGRKPSERVTERERGIAQKMFAHELKFSSKLKRSKKEIQEEMNKYAEYLVTEMKEKEHRHYMALDILRIAHTYSQELAIEEILRRLSIKDDNKRKIKTTRSKLIMDRLKKGESCDSIISDPSLLSETLVNQTETDKT